MDQKYPSHRSWCGARCGNRAASSVTEAAENRDQEKAGTHTQETRP